MTRGRRVFLEARALALPLIAYWAATAMGLLTFIVALVFTGQLGGADGVYVVAACAAATVLGIGSGQVLALLRIRTPYVVILSGLAFVLDTYLCAGAAMGGLAEVAIFVIIIGLLFPFFLACGLWSLQTHMGMLATFAPIVFFTAAILTFAEHSGGEAAWFGGNKWAVWDAGSVIVLWFGVGTIVVYLVTRELHRLHRWRFAPAGPDFPASNAGETLARPGCGSLVALGFLAVALTIGTAAVAPYLWRTGPADNGGDGNGGGNSNGNGNGGGSEPQTGDGSGTPGLSEQQQEELKQAAKQGINALFELLLMLVLLVAGIAVFGPPLRRMLLLQHLRRPLWPVPPTARIGQHWRLVEIALGDLGYHRQPGDCATALARRAVGAEALVDPVALERCAEVADRVAYGIQILPADADFARRTAEMTYQAVWDELTERARIFAMYRPL